MKKKRNKNTNSLKKGTELILFNRKNKKFSKKSKTKGLLIKKYWRFLLIILILANITIWAVNLQIQFINFRQKPSEIASAQKLFSQKTLQVWTPAKKENNTVTKSPETIPASNNKTARAETVGNTVQIPAGFCLNVPVIFYHHIEPMDSAKKEGHAQLTVDSNMFEEHIKYLLSKGYRTISAEELANAIISHQQIPGKPIVITLDDGYIDAYSYAYPIAKKYNVILNLMIPTGLVENPDYLTWNDLREMVGSGLIFAYDHTWSHSSLGASDYSHAEKEIIAAKTQLEQQLGKQVRIFSYPYGTYGKNAIDVLRNNSFIAAFTTVPGFYQCDSFILELHRNRIGDAPLSYFGL